MTTARPNPYPGPRPFKQDEALYGRDRELLELLDLLIAERIVLLYSPSGAGKTSLIQAALIPALEREGFRVLPSMRVGLETPSAAGTANRYIDSALQSLEEGLHADAPLPLTQVSDMGLADYLSTRAVAVNQEGSTVLIFDQFEEILTVDPTDDAAKTAFFRWLGQALRDRQRWALFSMREEFVAGLDPYLRHLPTRLATTFRLELLGEEAALAAIQEPSRKAGVDFSDAAAHRLVDDLRTVHVQRPDGSTAPALGPNVEPVQLQVVCRRLWERLPDDATSIAEADIGTVGDVEAALQSYYAEQVAAVALATGVRERTIREWVDRQLITPAGIRGQVLLGADASAGLDDRAIWPLVDAHLVRVERRRGATWFELAHDRLIEPVRSDNAAWRAAHLSTMQQQAALWQEAGRPDGMLLRDAALLEAEQWSAEHADDLEEHERAYLQESQAARAVAERERRQARRIRRWAIGASIAVVIAVAALGGVIYLANQLQQQLSEVQRALSLTVAFESARHLEDQPDLALLLALEAINTRDTPEARYSLLTALEHSPQLLKLLSPGGRGAGQAIWDAAYSPDGKTLATAGPEGHVNLWNPETGQRTTLPPEPAESGNTITVAFDPTGHTLAAGTRDGRVILWTLSANQTISKTLGAHDGQVDGLAFSPDGRLLASVSQDGLRLWDMAAGGQPLSASLPQEAHESARSVAFSPDGRVLALGSDTGRVRRIEQTASGWQAQSLMAFGPEEKALVNAVAFSPDGEWLAAGTEKGTVAFWKLATGESFAVKQHDDQVEAIAFSPDSRTLASSGRDRTIRLWDVASQTPLASPLMGHSDWVTGVRFSPDGKVLASTGADGKVILWRASVGPRLAQPLAGLGDEGWAVAVNRAGDQIAASGKAGKVVLWNLSAGQAITLTGEGGPVRAVAFSPDGKILAAAGQDGAVRLWDATGSSQQPLRRLAHCEGCFVSDVAISSDGRTLASSGFDKRVVLWDLTANPPTSRALEGHADDVWSVAFNPDGTQLASCDARGQIRLWDARTGSAVGAPWLAPGSNGAICSSLAFTPYGGRLAAGDHDGIVTLWDVESAKPIGRLARHTGPVTDVAFSPDDRVLVSSSLDGTVILWDVESDRQVGEPLRAHVGPVNAVAFSPDGKTLVSAGDDHRVIRWNADLESWTEQACAIANRNLTAEEWQQYLPNIPYRETCPGAKLAQP